MMLRLKPGRRDNEIEKLNISMVTANKKITQAAQEAAKNKPNDKELAALKRENDVLKKDLKKSQDQVKRNKAAKPKQAKPVKIGAGVAKLTLENKRLNKYISELLAWGQVTPQYLDSFKHSVQGRLDIIDLKNEDSDVSEIGSVDKEIKSCRRFIVINNYNSIQMVTTVKGDEGMHNPIAPEGHHVTIDEEVNDYIFKYIAKSEVVNKQVNESIKTYG